MRVIISPSFGKRFNSFFEKTIFSPNITSKTPPPLDIRVISIFLNSFFSSASKLEACGR